MKRTNEVISAMKEAEETFKEMEREVGFFYSWCEQETEKGNMDMLYYYNSLYAHVCDLHKLYEHRYNAVLSVDAWAEDGNGEEDSEYCKCFCSKYLNNKQHCEHEKEPNTDWLEWREEDSHWRGEDPDWFEHFGMDGDYCDEAYNEKDAILNKLSDMYCDYCDKCKEILEHTSASYKAMQTGWHLTDAIVTEMVRATKAFIYQCAKAPTSNENDYWTIYNESVCAERWIERLCKVGHAIFKYVPAWAKYNEEDTGFDNLSYTRDKCKRAVWAAGDKAMNECKKAMDEEINSECANESWESESNNADDDEEEDYPF